MQSANMERSGSSKFKRNIVTWTLLSLNYTFQIPRGRQDPHGMNFIMCPFVCTRQVSAKQSCMHNLSIFGFSLNDWKIWKSAKTGTITEILICVQSPHKTTQTENEEVWTPAYYVNIMQHYRYYINIALTEIWRKKIVKL